VIWWGKRLDPRAVYCKVGIEEVSQSNALGLGGDTIRLAVAVAVEAEGAAGLQQLQARLVVIKENYLRRAISGAVDHIESVRADPLDAYHLRHRWA
jgi:hypothetical protein